MSEEVGESRNDVEVIPREIKGLLSSSKPCKNRKETIDVLEKLVEGSLSARLSNSHGEGPMLVSDVPPPVQKSDEGVILGIDEAGRGPVLGPMTYAAAYWLPSKSDSIPTTFNDSKQLSSVTRNSLFSEMQSNNNIGFVLRVLHASEISRNMLRAQPYNLNAMSHDAAIQMIHAVLDAGVKINTCYVDTVGIPDSYRRKLDQEFLGRNINFVVEKKADAKYAPCSAASVVAKVSRDSILETWKWSEPSFEPTNGKDYGSGYPSDPRCKSWMDKNFVDPVFCFPNLVRFSWGPAKEKQKESGVRVKWEAEEEEEDTNQTKMNAFIQSVTKSGRKNKKRKRFDFFEGVKLQIVDDIVET